MIHIVLVSFLACISSSVAPEPLRCAENDCLSPQYPGMSICFYHHRLREHGVCTFPDCTIPAQSKDIHFCVNHRPRQLSQSTRSPDAQGRRIVIPSISRLFLRAISFASIRPFPSSPRNAGRPPSMPSISDEEPLADEPIIRRILKRSAAVADLSDPRFTEEQTD